MRRRLTVVLSLLALVVGFLITQQMRTVAFINRTAQVEEGRTLSQLVSQADLSNARAQAHIATIKARLAGFKGAVPLGRVKRQLARVMPLADLTTVRGSGIVVVMHDGRGNLFPGEPPALQLVHDQYVLRVIALISSAGAQAISINGQRYTATTAIYCAGPTIRINGVPYASPFVIRAVGPAQPMLAALNADPDIQGWSQLVFIHYHAQSHIDIAPYHGLVDVSLATPTVRP
jgi:uncharacterized protein YlxW (UPF0749 family)